MLKWLNHKTNISDLVSDIEQSLQGIEISTASVLERNVANALRRRGWIIQENNLNDHQVYCDYIARKESIQIPIEVKFLCKNALIGNTKSTYYIWQQIYKFEQFCGDNAEGIKSALMVVVTNDEFYQRYDVLNPIGNGRMHPEIVSKFGCPHLVITKSYNIEWKSINADYKMLIIEVMR